MRLNIESFLKMEKESIKNAQDFYVKNDLSEFTDKLVDYDWNIYEEDEEVRNTYEKLSETIGKMSYDDHQSELASAKNLNEMNIAMDNYSSTVFYRLCQGVGIEPEKSNSSWLSKSLIPFTQSIFLKSKSNEMPMFNDYNKNNFRSESEILANFVHESKMGEKTYSFFNAKMDNVKKKEWISDWVNNGDHAELAGYLTHYSDKSLFSGIKKLDSISFVGSATAMSSLLSIPNVNSNDLYNLYLNNVIEPKSLWETNYFHENLAPVVTDDDVSIHKKRAQGNLLLEKYKSKISDREILSVFLQSGRSEIQPWKVAMASFEAVTDRRLTFQEALDLNPILGYSIQDSQPFMNDLDKIIAARANKFLNISTESYRSAMHDEERGAIAFNIYVKSESIDIERIENMIDDLILEFDNIHASHAHNGSYHLDCYADNENYKPIADKICASLKESIAKFQQIVLMPGDKVRITNPEAVEYGSKVNDIGVISDVDCSGRIRLAKKQNFMPESFVTLEKKYTPRKEVDSTLDIG